MLFRDDVVQSRSLGPPTPLPPSRLSHLCLSLSLGIIGGGRRLSRSIVVVNGKVRGRSESRAAEKPRDGWVDGWMDGWRNGWTVACVGSWGDGNEVCVRLWSPTRLGESGGGGGVVSIGF